MRLLKIMRIITYAGWVTVNHPVGGSSQPRGANTVQAIFSVEQQKTSLYRAGFFMAVEFTSILKMPDNQP